MSASTNDGNKSGEAASPAAIPHRGFGASYPESLAHAENLLLQERRRHAGLTPEQKAAPAVGIAVSGGGIRSAIIALGVFQSLAARDLLKRVDYLSTVSGGSYFGSFLGAIFARGHDHAKVAELLRCGGPQQAATSGEGIDPVGWLRQNGRYLAPRGGTDEFRIFALTLRNWLALALVSASVLLTVCVGLQWLWTGVAAAIRWGLSDALPGKTAYGAFCIVHAPGDERCLQGGVLMSTSIVIAAPAVAFAAFCGFVFWFVGLFARADHMKQRRWRDALTSGLSLALKILVAIAAWVAIDSVAITLLSGFQPSAATLGSLGIIGTIVFALRRVLTLPLVSRALGDLWSSAHLPIRLAAWPVAIALWGSVLVGIDMVALMLLNLDASVRLWFTDCWIDVRIVATLLLLGLQLLTAFVPYFLNRSSQHAFYAERLIRSFIGASNPARFPSLNPVRDARNAYISDPIAGDDVPFTDYHLQVVAHGGPLHLINVTVNETISPYAATVLRDRNGVPMAIGPAGVSAGVQHHALDGAPRGGVQGANRADGDDAWPLQPDATDSPDAPKAKRFSMFGVQRFQAERLSLGYWTAISGAAVATGLGSYGGTALSLLVSLVNLRLGYWWNAGTVGEVANDPAAAHRMDMVSVKTRLRSVWRPMQAYLFSEMVGRFWGPHRPRWYLSDGGHSENTGALELIRRRLPEIIVLDTENSVVSPTGNLGDLVRKARQDYAAEISFDTDPAAAPFGPYLGLIPGSEGRGPTCAVRGTIRYLNAVGDEPRSSRLLYVRPVLADGDAPDLLRYAKDHPDFPYQSTADQFFDEAQWESYRKLGERIGEDIWPRSAKT